MLAKHPATRTAPGLSGKMYAAIEPTAIAGAANVQHVNRAAMVKETGLADLFISCIFLRLKICSDAKFGY